jgi:hypothetical protein
MILESWKPAPPAYRHRQVELVQAKLGTRIYKVRKFQFFASQNYFKKEKRG